MGEDDLQVGKIHRDVIQIESEADECSLDAAFQWTSGFNEAVYTFANNINTHEGGTHLTGVRTALTRTINDYARAKGEPDALLWYAETVLHQPRDSAPHDDHIHMRFACSEAEAVRGCIGGGPYWEFLPGEETPEPSDDELLAMALAEPPLPPIDAEPGPEPTTEPTPGPTTEPTAAAATP